MFNSKHFTEYEHHLLCLYVCICRLNPTKNIDSERSMVSMFTKTKKEIKTQKGICQTDDVSHIYNSFLSPLYFSDALIGLQH